jgi:hypothetical protein
MSGHAIIFHTLTHRSPGTDLFNDDFSYKRKLKIKLPTPDGVVSVSVRGELLTFPPLPPACISFCSCLSPLLFLCVRRMTVSCADSLSQITFVWTPTLIIPSFLPHNTFLSDLD